MNVCEDVLDHLTGAAAKENQATTGIFNLRWLREKGGIFSVQGIWCMLRHLDHFRTYNFWGTLLQSTFSSLGSGFDDFGGWRLVFTLVAHFCNIRIDDGLYLTQMESSLEKYNANGLWMQYENRALSLDIFSTECP